MEKKGGQTCKYNINASNALNELNELKELKELNELNLIMTQ